MRSSSFIATGLGSTASGLTTSGESAFTWTAAGTSNVEITDYH
jgi:hypothetical protein